VEEPRIAPLPWQVASNKGVEPTRNQLRAAQEPERRGGAPGTRGHGTAKASSRRGWA